MNTKFRRLTGSIVALAAAGALVAGCSSDGASAADQASSAVATATSAVKDAGSAVADAAKDAGDAVKDNDGETATIDGPDGSITVHKEIAEKYAEIGGPVGHFGTPEGEQEDGPDGGASVEFQRGVIFWSADTGAHFITAGAILDAFNEAGGLDELGYPTDDPKDSDGGKTVDFQNGHITDKDGNVDVVKN